MNQPYTLPAIVSLFAPCRPENDQHELCRERYDANSEPVTTAGGTVLVLREHRCVCTCHPANWAGLVPEA